MRRGAPSAECHCTDNSKTGNEIVIEGEGEALTNATHSTVNAHHFCRERIHNSPYRFSFSRRGKDKIQPVLACLRSYHTSRQLNHITNAWKFHKNHQPCADSKRLVATDSHSLRADVYTLTLNQARYSFICF